MLAMVVYMLLAAAAISVFSTGYHYAFGIAAGAMLLSLTIYLIFRGKLQAGDLVFAAKKKGAQLKRFDIFWANG